MTPRCQSCGRALAADGCRHPDCSWQPPFPYEPVDAERGLEWVRATRALLHSLTSDHDTARLDHLSTYSTTTEKAHP